MGTPILEGMGNNSARLSPGVFVCVFDADHSRGPVRNVVRTQAAQPSS